MEEVLGTPDNSFMSPMHCCCIESVPVSTEKHFACGMYELVENTQNRLGKVAICDESSILFDIETASGVLDIKFRGSTLACALSSGHIVLYEYQDSNLRHIETVDPFADATEGLALSVCWESIHADDDNCSISNFAISSENGSIQIYASADAGYRMARNIPRAHVLFDECVPAWITAYNVHDSNVLVSGGDDLAVRLWDVRSASPVFQSSKHFTAGVTSAQWHPHAKHCHILAVGSYDGSVKVYDQRSMRVPLVDVQTGAVEDIVVSCF
jgi:diphthine methyl ester acylhydrolase